MINNNRGKVIWYVSHYIGPPEFDTHSRALKFTQYLQDAGYEVIILGSVPVVKIRVFPFDLVKSNVSV